MASNAPDDPEVLLGFDAREMISPAPAWDTDRREVYLLRPGVERPLSVDVAVWPSVFEASGDWRGPVQELWDDLGRMDQALRALPGVRRWRIAVAWIPDADRARAASGVAPPNLAETVPGTPGDGWSLLGYDIADGALTSGLSNCGYEPSERASLRRTWGSELNEHHLFESPATARAFRDATNARVPEHAPFFVYCVLRIDDAEE